MSEDIPQQKKGLADITMAVMGFEKIVVGGLLLCLFSILAFSFLVVHFGAPTPDVVNYILDFWKNIGLILVGALANSVQQKKQ